MPYTKIGAYYPGRFGSYQPKPKYVRPDHIGNFVTKEVADKMISFVSNYTGDFPPIVNMKAVIDKGLTQSQWSLVLKSVNYAEAKEKKDSFAGVFKSIAFLPPIDAVLNKSIAYKHFKGKLKLNYAVYTVRIKEILDAIPSRGGNYWKVKLKVEPNTDGVVDVCRMCGKSLTDHTSIVTGVGPYCAKKLDPAVYDAYKKDTDKFMKMFKDEVSKIGETEIECWHNTLDDRAAHYIKQELDKMSSTATTKANKPNIKVLINHIEYNNELRTFYIKPTMDSDDVNNLYSQLGNGEVNITVVNPKTNNHVTFEFSGLHSFKCLSYIVTSHNANLSTVKVKDNNFKLLIELK